MKKIALVILLVLSFTPIWAQTGFQVQRIKVLGLHRVSRATFLSYMPVQKGERFSPLDANRIIQDLYKTGFFSKINLYREGRVLVVKVDERPVIGAIHIAGNKEIATKDLLKVLKKAKLTVGQVFNSSVLDNIRQALLQQYYNLGRYNARVYATASKKARKRVLLSIVINEGPIAKIKSIRIIGNHRFSEHELLKNFSLAPTRLWSFITKSDHYSKVKLNADLENLNSFYLNRGYLQFKIDSKQVTITPKTSHVYIVIHVSEGPVYTISGISFSGYHNLAQLVKIRQGEVFSRQKVIDSVTAINTYFGDHGYAFPSITPVPRVDNIAHRVAIKFVIKPGKRIYVRRINFVGNSKTSDTVLRREMRQMEGGLFSLSNIKESTRRLNGLGYLKNVRPQLNPVPGSNNKVDVNYHMDEASSTTASLNIGYSDIDKFLYGASINDQNFLGSGKAVGLQFSHSAYSKSYGFSYLNPYHTINNVSLGVDLYAQLMTPNDIDLTSYSTKIYGGAVTYGYPVSEHTRFNIGYGYEHTRIHVDAKNSPAQINSFIKKFGHAFDVVKLTSGWTYNNLDRAVFPTKGFAQSLGVEVGVPVMHRSLEYYKLNYNSVWYHPLSKYFILQARSFIGYGRGYGKYYSLKGLPFFYNYFAGGIGSVRGFEPNSLGPYNKKLDEVLGGNVSVNGSLGLIFPNPLGELVRTSAFVDVGNVFRNQFSARKLDASVGVQMEWHIMFPIVVSVAVPIHRYNKKKHDNTTLINFSFGGNVF